MEDKMVQDIQKQNKNDPDNEENDNQLALKDSNKTDAKKKSCKC